MDLKLLATVVRAVDGRMPHATPQARANAIAVCYGYMVARGGEKSEGLGAFVDAVAGTFESLAAQGSLEPRLLDAATTPRDASIDGNASEQPDRASAGEAGVPALAPPFRLLHPQISRDSIGALDRLLGEARRGELNGLVVCAMYRGGNYAFNTTGEAARRPEFALGALQVLGHELSSRIARGRRK